MEQAEVLARLRKEKGLSQAEVAEELGVTRQAVSRWESGRAWPSAEKLVAVSRLYGVTVEELLQSGEEQTEEAEPPTEEDGREGMAVNEQTAQPQSRSHNRLWWLILAAVFCGGVLLWGKLTNSMLLAGGFLVLAIFIAVLVCLLYGLFKIIAYFRKDG